MAQIEARLPLLRPRGAHQTQARRRLVLGATGLILSGLVAAYSGIAISRTPTEMAQVPSAPASPSTPSSATGLWGLYAPDIYIDEIRGRLRLNPFITTGVSYTDNADFDRDRRDDFVYFIQPGLSLDLEAPRFRTTLSASASAEYSTDEQGFTLRQVSDSRLESINRFELFEDIAFVDAEAAISQELLDAESSPSARTVDRSDDFTTVQRYRVSPFVRYRFGRSVENETRVTFGYVDTGEEDEDASVILGAGTTFSSGPVFNRFQWRAQSQYDSEDATNEDERFERFTNELGTRFEVDRSWALLATVGHDAIDDAEIDDLPDGVFWNVGVNYQPNPRLDATLTFGRRFENNDLGLNILYDIAPGSRFRARFQQTLETEERRLLRDLDFLSVDAQGRVVDTRTGEPIEGPTSAFGVESETFLRNRFDANLIFDRRRNNYRFGGFFESREIQTTPTFTERAFGATADWRRQLNRETTGRFGIEYERTNFDNQPGRIDDLYTVRTSISHSLGDGLSVLFGYTFQHQDSTIADETATENLVTLSLTKRF